MCERGWWSKESHYRLLRRCVCHIELCANKLVYAFVIPLGRCSTVLNRSWMEEMKIKNIREKNLAKSKIPISRLEHSSQLFTKAFI